MLTVLRRLFWLGLLGGAGYAGWSAWQGRRAPAPAAAPEWPPMPAPAPTTDTTTATFASSGGGHVADADDDAGTADATSPGRAADAPANGGTRWVLPADDGTCPEGFPVKANDNSGIYHVPGGRFYDRTVPERCYAETADAEADGYRAAKA